MLFYTGHVAVKLIYEKLFWICMDYKMSKELAEFVGVVIGDGSIRYKPDISQYYVEIAGNMYEEKDYYNYCFLDKAL